MADLTRTASQVQHGVTASAADPEMTTATADATGVAPAPPPAGNRYLLGEEIARGGMGVVYRATDTAFGREVAVKVLQDKYGPASTSARRFGDEARITGQLQHPAIPPVHDLGTLPDGRPFLAMKLIKGQTLDDALKARADLSAERGKFVAAFEQVCHAVAYAHAHKVIHRDLKPANVMVGAFGEVQVMDWGLAKVLGSRAAETSDPDETAGDTAILSLRDSDDSFTHAGAILGTPAFMPPEQAVGAIGKIDARSDVFGLGAILAVILTGKPPFAANSVETTRVQAAQGNVEECFARLAACGADPDLVALCKRCLSPKAADRPADAGEVARAVVDLRAAADERARQAELDRVKAEGEKATAEAKAAEQRKRRRVQSALAGLVLLVVVGGGIAAVQVQRQREQDRIATERETRAASLVDSLGGADTPSVPRIIEDLADLRDLARPKLDEMRASEKPRQKLHAALALLPVDPGQVGYLHGRLLDAEPHEVPVIRDALAPHKDELRDKLWAVVDRPEKGKEPQRLRVAAALAKYDPGSEKWAAAGGLVAEQLVGENVVFLGLWMEAFRPINGQLLAPLGRIYRNPDRRESERSVATDFLADYAADRPQFLADLLMDADEKQFAVIYPKFKEQSERGSTVLAAEIDRTLPPDLPSSDGKRETLAKRQANAAVALLRLNQPAKAWPLLKHSPDPRVRSYLIHRLSPLGGDAKAIAKQLEEEKDITIRSALLLSLGEFSETDLTPADRKALLPKLQEMYKADPDPGLHAASEWLLRQWKQEAWLTQVNEEWAKDGEGRDKRIDGILKQLASRVASAPGVPPSPPQWYVNTQGQTYVVIPGPVEFRMGSPKTEKYGEEREARHKRRIGRSFAIASKSVTLAEYRRLTKDNYELGERERWSHSPDLPVVGINWFMAATYCNLLSKAEGIPEEEWVYEINGPDGIKLKANNLSLRGYRLPTEAEMEYATRAGAGTSRYYGETDELLGQYAWYMKNTNETLQRVGRKKPNDFGLFDSLGNCFTWCQEMYAEYPKGEGDEAVEDKGGDLVIISTRSRVMRGGSSFTQASLVRSSLRNANVPTSRDLVICGVRPVRTLRP